MRELVACLGAGRMGRGIAVVFAFAGHEVAVVDFKPRTPEAFARLAAEVRAETRGTLDMLARIGLLPAEQTAAIAARVRVVPEAEAATPLSRAAVVFEGVPEILPIKREALAGASRLAGPQTIIASTTSTLLVDALADAVADPGRFLNAHWLNPAFLVPLVEVSPGAATAPATTARLVTLLEAIGKVPVVCAASPGFIVPRIQVLAMNEAARMVEEGVASAADIDRAVKYGFGFRFARAGIAGVHRLGRRRHTALRQRLPVPSTRPPALRGSRHRIPKHGGRAHRHDGGKRVPGLSRQGSCRLSRGPLERLRGPVARHGPGSPARPRPRRRRRFGNAIAAGRSTR